MRIQLCFKLKMHKSSLLLIAVAAAFMFSLLAAPVASISTNQCGSCHGTSYSQQIDLVEASSGIPSSLQVGQTVPVTIVIQNINNAPRNNLLSNVQVTLNSQSGRFSINSPTYTVGTLSTGTATATFQVTGLSAGADQFVISASARNTHENIIFADTYSLNPSITVTAGTAATSSPTPQPTTQPTTNPTNNPTPTAPPSPTPNLTPAPTSLPSVNPTNWPSPTADPSTTPTDTTSPTPTPDASAPPTKTPDPTVYPTSTPTPIDNHSDQLNSNMLYIHPPLAIAGYVFIFIFTALTIKVGTSPSKSTKTMALGAWALTALGLFTGMLWAQVAWGSYWSWGIKETLTLALFLTLSAGEVAYFERKPHVAKLLLVATCILVVVTASSSLILAGLHSYL